MRSEPQTAAKVVENAKIKNFEENGSAKTASFTLEKSILMNQEYSLVFTLNTDKGPGIIIQG